MQEIFLQTWIKELHKNLHFMETYRVFLVFSLFIFGALFLLSTLQLLHFSSAISITSKILKFSRYNQKGKNFIPTS